MSRPAPIAARQSAGLARALQAVALVNQRRQPAVPDLFSQVKEVVVIASSSRGGSSIFTEILRQSPELIHCKGEINPYLAIAGLTYPASGRADDSLDALDAGPQQHQKLATLAGEMALDIGVSGPLDLENRALRERFLHDLLWRITIQWPEIEIEPDFLLSCADQTLTDLVRCHGWLPGRFDDPQLFHALFLARLRDRYPGINPHYYDLSPELIRRYCPGADICCAPPASLVIEEPPFVLIAPRQPVTPEMLARQPLILKTPSNVYRLAFLRQVFRQARFRILHLVRRPADAINGLVDGWQYHGFFSHALPYRLDIQGYSDRFPEWGRHWWKYDLPPDWRQWIGQPLEQVCAYQWRRAHQAILDYLAATNVDALRVAFDEVIGPLPLREQRFTEIANWLGVDPKPLVTAAVGDLAPVMATARPRQRRWFKKAALLQPVLNDPLIIETAQRLGYEKTHDLPE